MVESGSYRFAYFHLFLLFVSSHQILHHCMFIYFFQKELISGDQNGNIRVWDLAANSCSCELVSHFLIFQYHGTAVEREMQENN